MSSTSDSEEEFQPLKKRQRHPENYKRFVIKNAKVKGLEHKNWKGKLIPARVTGPDCRYVFSVCLSYCSSS